MTPVVQLEDLVDQCRAAELLARLVHRRPGHQLVWFLHEDGIVGHPATHIPSAEARARFTAWTQMLGLQPDPEQLRRGTLRLRAQGLVDGVQVTLSAQCYTH
jgi:hypothetical protein